MANNENKLILVTGATGHQGGAVLRHLQQRKFPYALSREMLTSRRLGIWWAMARNL